jgi:hypothetical protein
MAMHLFCRKSLLRDHNNRTLIAELFYTYPDENAHLPGRVTTLKAWRYTLGKIVDLDYSFEEVIEHRRARFDEIYGFEDPEPEFAYACWWYWDNTEEIPCN